MSHETQNLYLSDEYMRKHPTLHEEDSPWKCTKIFPLIDQVFAHDFKPASCLTLLDVGGGAGIILNSVASYIGSKFGVKVRKICLDLSPGMLKVQVKNNPDVIKALNQDICQTSLTDKEIDIAMMIDVLEHVPEPVKALKELNRISKYAILKAPLESNFFANLRNMLNHGRTRQTSKEQWGHINYYDTFTLLRLVKENIGTILAYSFTNKYGYFFHAIKPDLKTKIACYIGMQLHRVSPKLCGVLIGDYLMILVKCN